MNVYWLTTARSHSYHRLAVVILFHRHLLRRNVAIYLLFRPWNRLSKGKCRRQGRGVCPAQFSSQYQTCVWSTLQRERKKSRLKHSDLPWERSFLNLGTSLYITGSSQSQLRPVSPPLQWPEDRRKLFSNSPPSLSPLLSSSYTLGLSNTRYPHWLDRNDRCRSSREFTFRIACFLMSTNILVSKHFSIWFISPDISDRVRKLCQRSNADDETIKAIFLGPPLWFDEVHTGYMYTGPFIGAILGFLLAGLLADWSAKIMIRRNKGVYEPEFRIILVVAQLVFGCAGLYGFGITAKNVAKYGWFWPDFFYALEVIGMVLGAVASALYIVDAHRKFSLSYRTALFGNVLIIAQRISLSNPSRAFLYSKTYSASL